MRRSTSEECNDEHMLVGGTGKRGLEGPGSCSLGQEAVSAAPAAVLSWATNRLSPEEQKTPTQGQAVVSWGTRPAKMSRVRSDMHLNMAAGGSAKLMGGAWELTNKHINKSLPALHFG